MGLEINSSAPASNPLTRSSSSPKEAPFAVRRIKKVVANSGSDLI